MTAITPGGQSNAKLNALSRIVKEVLPNQTAELIRQELDFFGEVVLSNASLANVGDKFGKNAKILKTFQVDNEAGTWIPGAQSGFEDFLGVDRTTLGSGERMALANRPNAYPDDENRQRSGFARMAMTLTSWRGNMKFSMSELDVQGFPTVTGSPVAAIFNGYAKRFARRIANEWFTNKVNKLCDLGPTSGHVVGANNAVVNPNTLTFNLNVGDFVMDRFSQGMNVDIFKYDTAGNLIQLNVDSNGDRIVVYVEDYNHATNEVRLVGYAKAGDQPGTPSTGLFDPAILGNDAFLVIANSTVQDPASTPGNHNAYGIYKWRDWCRFGGSSDASNRILGARADSADFIDLRRHSAFRSLYFDYGGATLTPAALHSNQQNWQRHFMPLGYDIDTFIASSGTIFNMLQQMSVGRSQFSQGTDVSPVGLKIIGENMTQLPIGSKLYTIKETQMIENGRMLGIKGRGNWEIYTLPMQAPATGASLDGAGSRLSKLNVIPLGPRIGMPEVFSASVGSTSLTDELQVPCLSVLQVCPKVQIPMVLFDNIATSLEYQPTTGVDTETILAN